MNEKLYQRILQVDFQAAIFYEQMCKTLSTRTDYPCHNPDADLLLDWVEWRATPQGNDYWYDIAEKLGEIS